MGLLDFNNKEPERYTPPRTYRRRKDIVKEEEERMSELNNDDRSEITEDFSDSPHLN